MFDNLKAFCIFIGYPRSGHTLIGSLLNAHPDMVICHELDALGSVQQGVSRQQLLEQIIARDEEFGAKNRKHVYNYAVRESWQGRWRELQVIGDKKGSKSALRLHDDPGLLDTLTELVRLPLRILHVNRNPWDNIATIARRDVGSPDAVDQYLATAVEKYFTRCESVKAIRERQDSPPLLDVYHEDFVADPRGGLKELSDFLGVAWDESWAEASSAIVYVKPHRSRFAISWPEAIVDQVRERMAGFSWFRPEHHILGEPTPDERVAG